MKHTLFGLVITIGTLVLAQPSHAVVCANGVYRAGCAGPGGAAVVHKPVHRARPPVACATGVYRAGCVGPNGAAVVRKY